MRGICDQSEFKIFGKQKSLRKFNTKPSAKTSSEELGDEESEFDIQEDFLFEEQNEDNESVGDEDISVHVPSDSSASSVSVPYVSASIKYSDGSSRSLALQDINQEEVDEDTQIINIQNNHRVFEASRNLSLRNQFAGLAHRMSFIEKNINTKKMEFYQELNNY